MVLGLGWGARARITTTVPPFHFLLIRVFLPEIPFRILGCKPQKDDCSPEVKGGFLGSVSGLTEWMGGLSVVMENTGAWASKPAWPGLYYGPCSILSFQVQGRSGLLAKPQSGPFRFCSRTQDTAYLGCYTGAGSQLRGALDAGQLPPPHRRYSLHLTSSPCELLLIRQNLLSPALLLCGFPVFITCFSGFPRRLASLYTHPIILWPSLLPTSHSAPSKQRLTWHLLNTYPLPRTVPRTVHGLLQ